MITAHRARNHCSIWCSRSCWLVWRALHQHRPGYGDSSRLQDRSLRRFFCVYSSNLDMSPWVRSSFTFAIDQASYILSRLIGGLAAKRALVSLFSALQIGTFLLSLGAGAYTIYLLYSDKWQEQCKEFSSSSNTDNNIDYCINLNNTTKTVTVVIQVIYWIVQFCTFIPLYDQSCNRLCLL